MTIQVVIVFVYMFLMLFVSWYSTKLQKQGGSLSFLFADRDLNYVLIGCMIAGLAIGGASTVGVAQNAYTAGLSAGWYDVAWASGAVFTGLFLAKKIRESSFNTINEMWGRVFGPTFKNISLIIQFIVNLVIVSLQIVAGGAILSALLPQFFTMDLGLIVSAAIFLGVAVVGGLWAASLTNVFNMIIIYIGTILGSIYAVKNFGGFSEIAANLPVGMSGDGSHWFHLIKGMGPAAVIAWIVTMLLQGIPNAGIMQSIVAAKSPGEAKKGVLLAALIMAPIGFVSAIFGIIAAAFFPGLESSAMALPSVVMSRLPSSVAGLLLAGLWAADVSTATGLMVTLGTMGTKDIVMGFITGDISDDNQLKISKLIIVGCAVAAYIMATRVSSVLGALMTALTMFAPYAILMTGMFLFPKTVKKSSGWVTFIVGLIFFLLAQYITPSLAIFGQPIYTVFLVSLVAYILCMVFDNRLAPVEKLYE